MTCFVFTIIKYDLSKILEAIEVAKKKKTMLILVLSHTATRIALMSKKGVKTSEGVKNFWFVKYDVSAFSCTKNYMKSFITRENIQFQNLMHFAIILENYGKATSNSDT